MVLGILRPFILTFIQSEQVNLTTSSANLSLEKVGSFVSMKAFAITATVSGVLAVAVAVEGCFVSVETREGGRSSI